MNLFSGIRIGKLKLKNRVAFAPIENGYADAGGVITERLIRFFETCAQNGCGLIITGSMAVDFDGKGVPSQLEIFDEARLDGLRELVARLHRADCKVATQLYHAGRQITTDKGFTPIGPSAVNCKLFADAPPPKEMDGEDMARVEEKFRVATRRALDLGFDLIEVHFAHGYLLHSFLSGYANRRSDAYGGTLENRMRFPMQVLKAVIEEAGGRAPVGVRLSVEEYLPGGLAFDEALSVCRAAEQAGAAVLSVSAGSYDSMEYMIQPMHIPAGFLTQYSRKLKQVLSIPVMVAGRLNTGELIRGVVENGDADIVAVGRGFFSDPAIIRKIRDGREGEIRPCTACNQGCLGRIFVCKDARCIFNPQTGFEGLREIHESAAKQKIGIVGAGVTGLLLARFFSEAGHSVTLFDEHIGGKLRAMCLPKDRENFRLPLEEARRMLERQNVTFVAQKVHAQEELDRCGFDRVFLATGSVIDPIPAGDIPVLEASEAMLGTFAARELAVVGGGRTGLEVARHLALCGKDVNVFEKDEKLGRGVGDTFAPRLLSELVALGIKAYTGRFIRTAKDVTALCPGTQLIVQCCGYKKDESLQRRFAGAVPVGSAKSPMDILDCGEDAWNAFAAFENGK